MLIIREYEKTLPEPSLEEALEGQVENKKSC